MDIQCTRNMYFLLKHKLNLTNQREGVCIQCFGNSFSVVLYITYAPSIQMMEQLLGSPVVYQFYDTWFFGL